MNDCGNDDDDNDDDIDNEIPAEGNFKHVLSIYKVQSELLYEKKANKKM